MNGFLNDLRFGIRQLAAKPGFAAAAILTLALGIGANTAVFSVLNGYLLKPLPYPQSRQLVAVNESVPVIGEPYTGVSIASFTDVMNGTSVFSAAALYAEEDHNFTLNGRTRRITVLKARSSLFDVLRVKPAIGHAFSTANEEKGRDNVTVLSYAFWQSENADNRIMHRPWSRRSARLRNFVTTFQCRTVRSSDAWWSDHGFVDRYDRGLLSAGETRCEARPGSGDYGAVTIFLPLPEGERARRKELETII